MNLSLILKALSNEHRLKIIQWLKEPKKHFRSQHCDLEKDGVCVGLIEQKTGLSQSTVSQYIDVLKRAGLIVTNRNGQWTYCKRNERVIEALIEQLKNI